MYIYIYIIKSYKNTKSVILDICFHLEKACFPLRYVCVNVCVPGTRSRHPLPAPAGAKATEAGAGLRPAAAPRRRAARWTTTLDTGPVLGKDQLTRRETSKI